MRKENLKKERYTVVVGPSEANAKVFANAFGLLPLFVEWRGTTAESVIGALNEELSNLDNEVEERLKTECERVLSLSPLQIMVFDDEDSPRQKLMQIARSVFVPISVAADSPGSHVPEIFLARRVRVEAHKHIDDVLRSASRFYEEESSGGLLIISDVFSFPDEINGELVKRISSNRRLVDLSAYDLDVILDRHYAPILRIHDEISKRDGAGAIGPLILPLSRIWYQHEISAIERLIGLPVLPKVLFSEDPALREAFCRTVLYVVHLYDSFQHALEGDAMPALARQPLLRFIRASAMDLRGCVNSRPELIKKLIVDLRHHCAIPITIIKQVLHDLEHKGLAPQEGYLQISSGLDELLEIITSHSDDALLAFQAEDETSVLDLCSVIQEAVSHVQTRHQHQARFSPCKLELPSVPIEMCTNRVLLHRILEAILDNAYDAIAECAPRSDWKPEVSCCLRIKPVELGKLVLIEIRDNGDGIAQENLDNIWGTFSTKGAGRGQGLNGKRDELKQLRGTIDVDTKLNEGSRFILKFGKERETDRWIP